MTIIGKPVYSDELLHYQVKGAKHGVRRWQYPDGSLTPAGRIHYGVGPAREKRDYVGEAEKDVADLTALQNRKDTAQKTLAEYNKQHPWYKQKKGLFESKAKWEARIENERNTQSALYKNWYDTIAPYNEKRDELQKKYSDYANLLDEIVEHIELTDAMGVSQKSKRTERDTAELSVLGDKIANAVETYIASGHNTRTGLDAYRETVSKIKEPKDDGKSLVNKLEKSYRSGGDKPAMFSSIKEVRDVDVSALAKILSDMDTINKAHNGKAFGHNKEFDTLNEVAGNISRSMAKKMTGSNSQRTIDDYDTYAEDALGQYFIEKASYLAKKERGDSTDGEFYWYFNPEEEERHKQS
jgi:hypothetical protein